MPKQQQNFPDASMFDSDARSFGFELHFTSRTRKARTIRSYLESDNGAAA
jgi:hypothetical protein